MASRRPQLTKTIVTKRSTGNVGNSKSKVKSGGSKLTNTEIVNREKSRLKSGGDKVVRGVFESKNSSGSRIVPTATPLVITPTMRPVSEAKPSYFSFAKTVSKIPQDSGKVYGGQINSMSGSAKPNFFKSFKGGFSQGYKFEDLKINKNARPTVREVGQISGVVGSIATIGGAPQRVIGAKLGTAIGQTPKLVKPIESLGRALSSTKGRLVTKGMTGLFAIGEGVKAINSGVKNGSQGVARSLFGSTKIISSFKGFGSGLSKSLNTARKTDIFYLTGDSQAVTGVSNSKFATSVKTSGTISRFTRSGKFFETKNFRDVSSIKGSSNLVAEIKANGVTSSISQVDAKMSSSTEVFKGAIKPANLNSQVSADTNVKAVFGVREQDVITVNGVTSGIGGSRVKFMQESFKPFSNSYSSSSGAGKSSYSFIGNGEMSNIKGSSSVASENFASKFNFKESVLKIGGSSGSSSGSSSGLVQESVLKTIPSKLISNSKLTTNVQSISKVRPLKSVFFGVSKFQTKTTPRVVKSSSVKSGNGLTSVSKGETKKTFKTSSGLTSVSKGSTVETSRLSPVFEPLGFKSLTTNKRSPKTISKNTQIIDSSQGVKSMTSQKRLLGSSDKLTSKSIVTSKTSFKNNLLTSSFTGFKNIPFTSTEIPRIGLPRLSLGGRGLTVGKRKRKGFFQFKTYTPTFTSAVYNIKSNSKNSLTKSGLTLRGLK